MMKILVLNITKQMNCLLYTIFQINQFQNDSTASAVVGYPTEGTAQTWIQADRKA